MAERVLLLAEFSSADALLEAIGKARGAGFRRIEAFTPFPVEGLAEALGIRERAIGPLTFAGGVFGALLGYLMQVYVNLDYPLNVGGRDLIAVPAFLVVTFELTILFAVLAAILGMLVLDRLPRLNHPLFEVPRFRLASLDRFFLCLESEDRAAAERLLRSLAPVGISEVAG
jgi:hypothetical protein